MGSTRKLIAAGGIGLILAMSAIAGLAAATGTGPTTMDLGTAANFAVLAGSAITNTGTSAITGDVGSDPTPAITGITAGMVTGTIHGVDAATTQAKTDLDAAYGVAVGLTPDALLPTELGATTVTAGVYNSAAGTFGITTDVTLDGENHANAVFVFQMATTLTTAASIHVLLINGAQSCNVYWQVGSSATLGASNAFRGNILAQTSITIGATTTIDGRALARDAAVTMGSDTITAATCAPTPTPTPTVAPTPTPTVAPTPTPTPVPTPTPTPVPTPTPTPTPVPTPTPTPVPTPTPTPVPTPTPTPVPTPTPTPAPTPTPTPVPTPVPTPTPTPTPTPSPSPSPTPTPTPTPTLSPAPSSTPSPTPTPMVGAAALATAPPAPATVAIPLAAPVALAEIITPMLGPAAAPVFFVALFIQHLPSTSTSPVPDRLPLVLLLAIPAVLFLFGFRRFAPLVRI